MVICLSNEDETATMANSLRIGHPMRVMQVGQPSLRWPVHMHSGLSDTSLSPVIFQTPPMVLVDSLSPPSASFTGTSKPVCRAMDVIREVFKRLCLAATGTDKPTMDAKSLLPNDPITDACILRLDIDPLRKPSVFHRSLSLEQDDDSTQTRSETHGDGLTVRRFHPHLPAGENVILLLHVDHVWSNVSRTSIGVRTRLLQLLMIEPFPMCRLMQSCAIQMLDNSHSKLETISGVPAHTKPPPPLPPPQPPRPHRQGGRPAPPSLEQLLMARSMLKKLTHSVMSL